MITVIVAVHIPILPLASSARMTVLMVRLLVTMSEKPLAPMASDARQMADAAAAKGVKTQVGFNYLCNPMLRLAREMIAKKNAAMGNDAPVAALDMTDGEDLQSIVFAVGKNHGFENLRDWFAAIYEVLMGASQGPRFGSFIALYGVDETITLIEQGLAGDLG